MIRKKKKEKKKFASRNPRKKKKSKTPHCIDQFKNTMKKGKVKKKQSTHEKDRWFYDLTTTTFLLLLPYFIPRVGR